MCVHSFCLLFWVFAPLVGINGRRGRKALSSPGTLLTSPSQHHLRRGGLPLPNRRALKALDSEPEHLLGGDFYLGCAGVHMCQSLRPAPRGWLFICGPWGPIVVATKTWIGSCVTMLVPLPALLPAGGRTKRAGIVSGINEPLSKQTPRERGSLVTAACVSLDSGPHSSQRELWGLEEAFPWWSSCAQGANPKPTACPCHPQTMISPNWTAWVCILEHVFGKSIPHEALQLCIWSIILFSGCSATEVKNSLFQGRHWEQRRPHWVFTPAFKQDDSQPPPPWLAASRDSETLQANGLNILLLLSMFWCFVNTSGNDPDAPCPSKGIGTCHCAPKSLSSWPWLFSCMGSCVSRYQVVAPFQPWVPHLGCCRHG